jgi:hypothetical protein
MTLVAVVSVPFHANFAEHSLMVTLIDQDGKPAGMQAQGVFRAAPVLEHKFGAPGLTPAAFSIQGLQIPRPGDYKFVLSVDGTVLDDYGFSVIQVANIAVPPPLNPSLD